MKKIFVYLIVLVMILSITMSAFAANSFQPKAGVLYTFSPTYTKTITMD